VAGSSSSCTVEDDARVFVTALVGIDIWRYLTALTALIVVLFARCSQAWRPRQAIVLMSASLC